MNATFTNFPTFATATATATATISLIAAGFAVALLPLSSAVASEATHALLAELQTSAARPFSAQAGQAIWFADSNGRSCTSCHTDSVYVRGRHQRTGKVIEPMAPSVNPERLSSRRKINKWLLRNCKWTFGRECTAQEKGDIVLWLSGL